jgi:hypothetical protein
MEKARDSVTLRYICHKTSTTLAARDALRHDKDVSQHSIRLAKAPKDVRSHIRLARSSGSPRRFLGLAEDSSRSNENFAQASDRVEPFCDAVNQTKNL